MSEKLLKRPDVRVALESLASTLRGQFEDNVGTHTSRLEQLEGSLATAVMAAEALFDEEEKETDLAKRVMSRTRVHGDNEIVSPIGGRTLDHYAEVSKRSK
jgi:hypothetical protein